MDESLKTKYILRPPLGSDLFVCRHCAEIVSQIQMQNEEDLIKWRKSFEPGQLFPRVTENDIKRLWADGDKVVPFTPDDKIVQAMHQFKNPEMMLEGEAMKNVNQQIN